MPLVPCGVAASWMAIIAFVAQVAVLQPCQETQGVLPRAAAAVEEILGGVNVL